jgi:hypothetical protein
MNLFSKPALPWAALLCMSALLAMLSGCSVARTITRDTPTQTSVSETSVAGYLDTMQRLANGEPAQQADVFYETEHAYTSAPTTANTLRHAIALVTPGHPASNLATGKRLLEQLLATPERLVPAERNLAAFLVKDVDTRLQLEADIRRLTATVDERTRAQLLSERRAQSQLDEVARLKRALQDAQRQLDAVKSIERSIIERNTPPAANRDTPARE